MYTCSYSIAIQVGTCIVDKSQKIIGIGYNGFPIKISDDDPTRSWGKPSISMGQSESTEEHKHKVGE
jgi:deoxycytidylate deaminase